MNKVISIKRCCFNYMNLLFQIFNRNASVSLIAVAIVLKASVLELIRSPAVISWWIQTWSGLFHPQGFVSSKGRTGLKLRQITTQSKLIKKLTSVLRVRKFGLWLNNIDDMITFILFSPSLKEWREGSLSSETSKWIICVIWMNYRIKVESVHLWSSSRHQRLSRLTWNWICNEWWRTGLHATRTCG